MEDLGNGIFDGAWLVSNFESNNPANTFWKKGYNVYANVDTEAKRYARLAGGLSRGGDRAPMPIGAELFSVCLTENA